MCSSFSWKRMESDGGDLGDVVRASGCGAAASSGNHPMIAADWQFLKPMSFPPSMEVPTVDEFGELFPAFRDPMLHELAGSVFFDRPDSGSGLAKANSGSQDGDGGGLIAQSFLGEEMKRPCNIFSRVLQISPGVKVSAISPRGIRPSPVLGTDMLKLQNNSPVDHGGAQISSPRSVPGIKRRKSQAKKVVCIPAPAAASSRPSGEVVPSDLWAWRKYGQKPIKGSPYPRGYYRCSSSKGCSARKQVERSRTDPNMLVITYTSEHNHPWPTQRNALAGSTRAQPSKNNSSVSKNSHHSQRRQSIVKEEQMDTTTSMITPVKEELPEINKPVDASDDTEYHHQVLCQSYKTSFPELNQPDDFFADLGELDSDPLSLVFSKGFLGDKSDEERDNKALDPFGTLDWVGNTFGENRSGGV